LNEKEIYKEIGKRIAALRKKNGMTQEALANMLSVTTKHISHVENGTSTLSLKAFILFCTEFSCSLDYLIFGKSFSSFTLPDGINELINIGSDKDRERLFRYLEFFAEISDLKK
jgi:predicted transcriptional regulators